jgi:Domain of unknown function (DUF4372)
MHSGKLIFAQLMEYLPAQLTFRESLRDIEACLRSQTEKLYHMGIRGQVSRNTLTNANATRDWRIYADFAQRLIGIARKLYINEPFGVDLANTAYALDSTTIDLSLSLFPRAPFRTTKAVVKMHTLLDLRGNIPSFIHISDGKLQETFRGIRYKDPETGKRLLFISNNTALPALSICSLYKARWQVELFFR